MPNKPTSEQLEADNQDLRARLEKAEATLSEILSGEADALFVTGVGGAQLFTLKGADQSYRTLIEDMSEGALTLTPEGLVLYANQRFAGMLRTPLEKVIGSGIHNWIAPENRQALQALLQKDALDNHREELALAAADGTRVPVYLSVSRLHLDGIRDSICMVATDLTEQKRNEAILAAEKLSNAILEQSADGIVICDKAGRIMRASKQAQAFYGKSPLGQQFEQAFPLRQLDGTAFSAVGTIDTNLSQSVEARLDCQGQVCDLLVSVGHLKGTRDELLGSVITLTDITERKQAEDKLLESKNLLQLVVENVPSRIFWKDSDLRYLGCNTRFAKDAGLSNSSELTGKTDFEMTWKDQAELYRNDDKAVMESGTAKLDIEEPQTTPDGNTIWLQTSKVPLRDKDKQIIGVLGLYRDITERVRVEQELLESERRFSDLLKNVELISMMLNREAQITYCNDYLLRLTGWKREEVIGKNWWNLFVPPEFRDLKGDFFAALLNNQPEALHHENDIVTRSGEHRLVRWNNSVLRSGAGEVIGTASIGEDITDRRLAELERQHREAELAESQRIARIGSWAWEIPTGVVTWSEGMSHVLARDRALPPPTFETLQQFYTPESWQRLSAAIANILETGASYDLELEMMRANGATCWTTTRGEVVRGADGAVVKLRGTVHDITDRREAEASIKSLNRVLSMLSNINSLIVRVHDRDELFREACRIAVEAGGFRMAMIVTLDRSTKKFGPVAWVGVDGELLTAISDILSSSEGAQSTMVAQAIREKKAIVSNDSLSDSRVLFGKYYAAAGVRSMVILPLIVSDEVVGTISLYASEIEFFHEEEMKLLTELAGDIAFAIDHLEKQEKLDYLAYYDVLTGLANRTLFLERVAQYMRSTASGGNKLAIGLIDLERFKNINDSLGRPAGDALLKQVAEWLTRNLGGASLLARVDADHFAVVIPEVKWAGDVSKLLDKTCQAFLDHPFQLNGDMFRIAAKVGIAIFPDDGDNVDNLFRNAEAALKKAKTRGDRYLFYTQKMTAAMAGKLTLENQLREAIDNEEFVLYYQPKVNLVSGKVTSAEALIRWNDPRTGLVPPGQFIPILEETGLIYEVGRWALRKAIADYLRWRTMGLPAVRIAVNVSPLQLRKLNFVAEIEREIGIDAHAAEGLELEITESLIMEDVQYSIDTLKAIRAMGITFAIDDFGTGFSSLNYLAKLPVDTLKIDRSFVIEMDAPEGLALVSTIILVAHALKLKVVAEGVETEKQSRQLLSLNCDEMQGFLFSKPVPTEIFETRFLAQLAGE